MGGGNLGDDATQDVVIQNIKIRWPNAEISLFSMNPADTRSRHGVSAYPIRTESWNPGERRANGGVTVKSRVKKALQKCPILLQILHGINTIAMRAPRRFFNEFRFLSKSFAVLRSFDLLIISGGGQLLDTWGGPWKFPYTIFKWTLLAKLSRTKCYFLNVGAGPLTYPLGKWFVRSALGLADYVSFRDEDSKNLVESVGYTGKSHVAADCVYALDSPAPRECGPARQSGPLVGLSPMAYRAPRRYWQKDQAFYERFLEQVASFANWLGDNRYRLALFSTDIWFDLQTIQQVGALLRNGRSGEPPYQVRQENIAEVNQLLSTIGSMDYIVTCRFHGVVFAHLLNKPVLALSHHPKVSSLMSDLGLARYCLDIDRCDAGCMQEAFLAMVANRDEIKQRMAAKAASYKKTVIAQFDLLFPESAGA